MPRIFNGGEKSMPTFKENIIGGGLKQFKWNDKTGVFSKKPSGMTDAQAMAYVNKSREESKQQDPRNQPPMSFEESAAKAFEELEGERAKRRGRKKGGSVKKYAKGGGVRRAKYK
jgi:hypothetical protein